jgi:hypothetical protein
MWRVNTEQRFVEKKLAPGRADDGAGFVAPWLVILRLGESVRAAQSANRKDGRTEQWAAISETVPICASAHVPALRFVFYRSFNHT